MLEPTQHAYTDSVEEELIRIWQEIKSLKACLSKVLGLENYSF